MTGESKASQHDGSGPLTSRIARALRHRAVAGLFAAGLAFWACSSSPDETVIALGALGPDDGLPPIVDRVGISHGMAWGGSPEATATRAAQIRRLQALGIRRVRLDFSWHRLEKKVGEWDFSQLDPLVKDADAAGIRLLALAVYGNPAYPSKSGASPGTKLPMDDPPEVFFPPLDPAPYAAYVKKVSERYQATVKDYELWNEENSGFRFWRPGEDPAAYAAYVRAAAVAGREVCVDCKYVLGGLSMPVPIPRLKIAANGPEFLRAIYAADPDLNKVIDAVAFHPYQYPKDPPELDTQPFEDRFQGSLATQTQTIGSIVDEHGSIPLWITENGWPTNLDIPKTNEEIARVFGLDPVVVGLGKGVLGEEDFAKLLETIRGVDERKQAAYIVRSIVIGTALKVPVNLIYTLDDNAHEPEINQEAAFGFFRVDGTEKPSAVAMRTLLQRFGRYRFVGDVRVTLGLSDAHRAFAFRDGDKTMIALWRWKDDEENVRIEHVPSRAVATSQAGAPLGEAMAGEALGFKLGTDVVYVELAP